MSGIGVILNPRSKRNLGDPRAADRLARALGDQGIVRTVKSRDDLPRIAEDFRRLGIDVLGIAGGDGTNYVTITGFLAVYESEPLPPLAFLRGGTFNTVANSVGVPRLSPDSLLAHLLRRYANRERHPLRWVERNVIRMGEHYGFIFGTGAIYGFIDEYDKTDVKDTLWAAKVLGRAAIDVVRGRPTPVARRWEGKVTLEDGTVFPEREYMAIGCGTVDQIGLGFTPFYRSREVPGKFHALGIFTSAMGFVRGLPGVWRARPMGPEHTYDEVTARATVEARSGVVEYMCDGDLIAHKGPLVLETGPRVRILVEHKRGFRPFGNQGAGGETPFA